MINERFAVNTVDVDFLPALFPIFVGFDQNSRMSFIGLCRWYLYSLLSIEEKKNITVRARIFFPSINREAEK